MELEDQGYTVQQQQEFHVKYRGQEIGKLVPDLIVEGKVIVDTKVVVSFNESHVAQMLGYLNAPSPFDKNDWYNTNDLIHSKGEFVKITKAGFYESMVHNVDHIKK